VDLRNERLYDALKAYYQQALGVLANERAESGHDEFADVKPEFHLTPGGAMSRSYTVRPDWSRLMYRSEDGLRQLEEYASLIDALTADETIADHLEKRVGIPGYYGWIPGAQQCVDGLLTGLLYRQDGGFEPAAFEAFYEEVERFFYADALEVRCLAPLGGFEMEAERIELDDGFLIVRISDAERAQMLSESAAFAPFVHGSEIGLRKYGLELYVELPKHVGVDEGGPGDSSHGDTQQMAREAFTEACSAMRLFKKGDVGFDHIVSHLTCWDPIGGKMRTGPMGTRQFFARTYTLSRHEADDFLEFWDRFSQARESCSDDPKKAEVLDIALRRFNTGYERSGAEDKLIDQMVGFEALLLPNVEGEYGYRMSLRAATLLGEDPHHRAAVQKNMKKAYSVRSEIVHGSRKKHETITLYGAEGCGDGRRLVDGEVTLAEFVLVTEDYLRSVIKKLHERPQSEQLDHIMDALDDEVVRGFSNAGED
jgi:hypothetical protein